MDVIGSGGPLGSRQLLAAQSENTRIDRPGRQAPGNRNAVRTLQETGAPDAARTVSDPNASRTVQRASRAVSAADIQNPGKALPRGSLVNILV